MLRKSVLAALALGAFCAPAPAFAAAGVKSGLLTCDVAGGWGYIVGSSRKLSCIYSDADTGRIEHYTGKLWKFGVDLGYIQGARMIWGVLTPTMAVAPGALAGNFIGATAGGSLGVGGNLNVLVGGQANAIDLQPVSMQGNTGVNIAAGMATLTLKYQPLFPNILK